MAALQGPRALTVLGSAAPPHEAATILASPLLLVGLPQAFYFLVPRRGAQTDTLLLSSSAASAEHAAGAVAALGDEGSGG